MKVLHLPTNIASQIAVTVRALRDIGINARGLAKSLHYHEDDKNIELLPCVTAGRYSVNRMAQKVSRWRSAFQALKWADIIHWYSTGHVLPLELDLKYCAFSNKPRVVEFWGSDVRIPNIARADNSYMGEMYQSYPQLAHGKRQRSLKGQRKFSHYGFACLVPDSEIGSYIEKDMWSLRYRSRQRLILSDFAPKYPDISSRHPVLIHAPSHKSKKGTEFILNAVKQLQGSYDFEFRLIHGVSHSEALKAIRDCDIMVDQIIVGSHGLAALEAMAFGKPTLCYIKPSLVPTYPPALPIVNASKENITRVLAGLLKDRKKRHEIGRQSRAYVEKYHDAHKVARDLVTIYEELLARVRKGSGAR